MVWSAFNAGILVFILVVIYQIWGHPQPVYKTSDQLRTHTENMNSENNQSYVKNHHNKQIGREEWSHNIKAKENLCHYVMNEEMSDKEGLMYSFIFMLFSEIGDKTFLFVTICASTLKSHKLLLASTIGIWSMHILGVSLGAIFQALISPAFLKYLSIFLFLLFGTVFVYWGLTEEEEDLNKKMEDVKAELKVDRVNQKLDTSVTPSVIHKIVYKLLANPYIRVMFTIVLTEMADRSQISAVALTANFKLWVIALGGSLGHFVAMALAVTAGKIVSRYATEKTMNFVGGICFLAFAVLEII